MEFRFRSRPAFAGRPRPPAALLALATVATLVGGCDDASGPNDALTEQQRDAIASVLRDEVEAAVGALTPVTALVPYHRGLSLCGIAPTPSAASADGDAVPDTAVWTFTTPCIVDGPRGSVAIRGVIELKDPAPAQAGFGYAGRLADYRFDVDGGGNELRTYSVVRNGTRALNGGPTGLTLTSMLTIVRTLPGFDVGAVEAWVVAFTPSDNGTLLINQPLPDGTVTITGTLDWTRPDETFAMTISTPTPLVYDADCSNPGRRFRSGELHAAGTFNGRNGTLRLVWEGCGKDPEIQFVVED